MIKKKIKTTTKIIDKPLFGLIVISLVYFLLVGKDGKLISSDETVSVILISVAGIVAAITGYLRARRTDERFRIMFRMSEIVNVCLNLCLVYIIMAVLIKKSNALDFAIICIVIVVAFISGVFVGRPQKKITFDMTPLSMINHFLIIFLIASFFSWSIKIDDWNLFSKIIFWITVCIYLILVLIGLLFIRTILDVSELKYSNKQLTLINVSQYTKLKKLYCDNNQLTSLDVGNNNELKLLWCQNNLLTSLNLSNNAKITELLCQNNQLTTPELNTLFGTLHSNAGSKRINISNNPGTNYCDINIAEYKGWTVISDVLDISNNHLTIKNLTLKKLICDDKQLTSLDVSENIVITELKCQNNQLTSLDVSKNTALTGLWCHYNQLTNIDVSSNTALTELNCYNNKLTDLDVKNNPALRVLYCYNNQLTSIDVSKNSRLTMFSCHGNQLTSLDVSQNTTLVWLWCQNNQLTVSELNALFETLHSNPVSKSIDIRNNPGTDDCDKSIATIKGWTIVEEVSEDINTEMSVKDSKLKRLICDNKQLTSLDVINVTELTILWCHNNQLTNLDISKNTFLTELSCYGNQLTELYVNSNTELIKLHCFNNKIEKLDLSNNAALTELYCYNNQITSLDVSNNTKLTILSCHSNQLTNLEVGKNTSLKRLDCSDNQLTASELNALFETLHSSAGTKIIDISNNPGTDDCDLNIATKKGWTVYAQRLSNEKYKKRE